MLFVSRTPLACSVDLQTFSMLDRGLDRFLPEAYPSSLRRSLRFKKVVAHQFDQINLLGFDGRHN